MTESELIQLCSEEGFTWSKGEYENKPGWFLHWPNPNNPDDDMVTHVQEAALPKLDRATVFKQVISGRSVYHMSRVVGYLSRINNWNKSKIGELKDRRKGNYGIQHVEKSAWQQEIPSAQKASNVSTGDNSTLRREVSAANGCQHANCRHAFRCALVYDLTQPHRIVEDPHVPNTTFEHDDAGLAHEICEDFLPLEPDETAKESNV